MPASDAATIDFKELKHRLMGSDAENPVGCAVALFRDHSVGLLVDKRKSGRALVVQMKREGGPSSASYFYGTAFIDKYPGTLCMNLNKAPASLKTRVRIAVRGSGFGQVELTATETDEDEAEG